MIPDLSGEQEISKTNKAGRWRNLYTRCSLMLEDGVTLGEPRCSNPHHCISKPLPRYRNKTVNMIQGFEYLPV